MRIAMGNDSSGYDLKMSVAEFVRSLGHEVVDYGHHNDEHTHSAIYAKQVADGIVAGDADLGILICGTGVGISIAANKVKGIRAVCCSEPFTARHSREHNNSNVLAFGALVVGPKMAEAIVEAWLTGDFKGGLYQQRYEMISAIEAGDFDGEAAQNLPLP